ncbi:MAG: hypothetical protein ACI9DJ_002820 [Algoriphagus sp.]|jgi:hypothetical protein
MKKISLTIIAFLSGFSICSCQNKSSETKMTSTTETVKLGVGAASIEGAEMYMDGTKNIVNDKWEYWEGPAFAGKYPIKWMAMKDQGTGKYVFNSNDPAAKGGKYGSADIVTKKKFNDFRAHVEFMIATEGGNSGVYLQNRYEIQVLDGDTTSHGMGAIINESKSPYHLYDGVGSWNAYDIQFRAARFDSLGIMSEKPIVSMYFNGIKAHSNVPINQVWGGEKSGLDGGNDGGKGITNVPGGLKLQAEGHDVLYRNIWIKEMAFDDGDTDF